MTQPRTQGRDSQRLGLIVPSPNTVSERDFWHFSPDTVTVHTARMYLEETTATDEHRMVAEYLPGAARDLATIRPDVVVFSCTSAGAAIGHEAEQQMIVDVERSCQSPIISTNASVSEAILRRQLKRIAVVTPYVDDLTKHIVAGMIRNGINVTESYGMGIVDPFAISEVSPEQIAEFVQARVSRDNIDGIFISCTNLRAYEAIEVLESWSQRPVVTSNHAALEAALLSLHQTAGPISSTLR